jgi:hypothetical protein
MQRWDEGDGYIEKQFKARISSFVAPAKVLDEKSHYQKKYYDTLNQLEKKKPYPSDEIDALNSRSRRDTKAFEDRFKQIESGDQSKSNIETAAGKHLFVPLRKAPGNLPAVNTPGAGDSVAVHSPTQPTQSAQSKESNPSTEDDGLPTPPIPNVIRKRCATTHADQLKQIDEGKRSVADLLDQAHREKLAAVAASTRQKHYEYMVAQANETVKIAERRRDKKTAAKAREDAATNQSKAESEKATAELATQKAQKAELQAMELEGRVRELTSQMLKDCQK